MTEAQLEWYSFIVPFTTIPSVVLLSYFRYVVIPVWFKSLGE